LDVSLELTSVCIVDERGTIVRETKVPSDPDDLVRYFRSREHPITRIALEAGPLSHWIHAGLTAARFDAVLLETRQVKAVLSATTVKTDRRDARGICAEGGVHRWKADIGGEIHSRTSTYRKPRPSIARAIHMRATAT
jgi:transposase